MSKKLRFKKGDTVIVTTGNDKGKKGDILKVLVKKSRVIVSGVNLASRHIKPSKDNPEGGIFKKELSIDMSNILHVDPKAGLPTRIGYKFLEDGQKVRYSKRSGEIIDRV